MIFLEAKVCSLPPSPVREQFSYNLCPSSRLPTRIGQAAPQGGGKNKSEGSILGGLGDVIDGDRRF